MVGDGSVAKSLFLVRIRNLRPAIRSSNNISNTNLLQKEQACYVIIMTSSQGHVSALNTNPVFWNGARCPSSLYRPQKSINSESNSLKYFENWQETGEMKEPSESKSDRRMETKWCQLRTKISVYREDSVSLHLYASQWNWMKMLNRKFPQHWNILIMLSRALHLDAKQKMSS